MRNIRLAPLGKDELVTIGLGSSASEKQSHPADLHRSWWERQPAVAALVVFIVVGAMVAVTATVSFRSSMHNYSGPGRLVVQLDKGEQVLYFDPGGPDYTVVYAHVRVYTMSGRALPARIGSDEVSMNVVTATLVGLDQIGTAETLYVPASGRYIINDGGFGPWEYGLVLAHPLSTVTTQLLPALFFLLFGIGALGTIAIRRRRERRLR
jgi:hypothetical protein